MFHSLKKRGLSNIWHTLLLLLSAALLELHKKSLLMFLMRGKQTFLFAHDSLTVTKSPQCHPGLLPLDLWQPGAPLLPEGPRAYRRVMTLPSSDTLSGLTRALCGGWKRAWPSGHKSARKASLYLQRVGFPPVIYSPHRDEVRHGHCLCTWAFIKQPGWALCRRHSNVQGAD